MKTFIISDIHGCVRALRSILSLLRPDPASDRLILLGDLFDRGPDSREVFQEVMTLKESFRDRFVLLRGNHEDYLLRKELSFMERLVWERVGRNATVKSFRRYNEKMEDAIPWLQANTVIFYKNGLKLENAFGSKTGSKSDKDAETANESKSIDRFFQCVHAGIMIDPIEANDQYTLVHDHSVVFNNRYPGPLTITGHVALDAPTWFVGDGKTTETIAYGDRRPLPEKGVICIDTGCGKGGKLTAMEVEEGHFTLYQVPEKGI